MNATLVRVACIALNPALDHTLAVDALQLGAVNRAHSMQIDIGGKGINVASCLADFGVQTAILGQLGRDNAAPFEEVFTRKRIHNGCLYTDGLTRINTKLVDASTGTTTDINMPGRELSATEASVLIETQLSRIDALLPHLQWVVLAGSLPPGMPADTYAQIARHVRAAGRQVAVDASGAALPAALAATPTLIKPNRAELAELIGRPLATLAEVSAAAQGLIAAHPGLRLVVVSLGGDGALFVDRNEVLHAHPAPITVNSTVGAGDAMVAGLVAAQLQGMTLEACAQLATAFAAAKLARLGPHLPPADAVRALAQHIEITRLNAA